MLPVGLGPGQALIRRVYVVPVAVLPQVPGVNAVVNFTNDLGIPCPNRLVSRHRKQARAQKDISMQDRVRGQIVYVSQRFDEEHLSRDARCSVQSRNVGTHSSTL